MSWRTRASEDFEPRALGDFKQCWPDGRVVSSSGDGESDSDSDEQDGGIDAANHESVIEPGASVDV